MGAPGVPRAGRMAQDWAGFSEEELRRLKQNKGSVDVPAGAESCVRLGLEASRVDEGAWGLEVQVGGRAGTVGLSRWMSSQPGPERRTGGFLS